MYCGVNVERRGCEKKGTIGENQCRSGRQNSSKTGKRRHREEERGAGRKERGLIEALATAEKEKRGRRLSRLRRLLPSSPSSSSPRYTGRHLCPARLPSRSSWRQVEMVKGGGYKESFYKERDSVQERGGERKEANEGERK